MRDVIYHTPRHVKKAKIGGSQIFQTSSFLISLASPRFSAKGKNRCGGVACKTFSKRDHDPKHTSMRSTKEMTVKLNRPPALYRLRVKAHTATPVWAFLFSALRARSAILGGFFARAPVHRSVWRPVSRAPPRRRATRRRARAPPSRSAI